MQMPDRAPRDRNWIVRLSVLGVVAALLPLVPGRAQVPKDDNRQTKTTTELITKQRSGDPAEKGNLDAEIEKARAETMKLEEETEEKYSDFKKSLRKFERAEDRLSELEFRAGRGGHRAGMGLSGISGNDPFAGGMAGMGQGMDMGQQGMAGMANNNGGMSPVALHWMMQLNEKIEWLHDELEDLKRARGGEAPPPAATTTIRER